ncbi:hypothetical protein PYCC9005_005900 [Savitreella phatthalungensis]
MSPSIATIDISRLAQDREAVIREIDHACRTSGFFQLVGHDSGPELHDRVLSAMADFFALPLQAKMKVERSVENRKQGYEPIGTQIIEKGTVADLKECFNCGDEGHAWTGTTFGDNQWSEESPSFNAIAKEYFSKTKSLSETLLELLGEAMGVGPDYFRDFARDQACLQRMLHYPPMPKDAPSNQRGVGAHFDFSGLTILLQDDVGGLEVFDAETQAYFPVPPQRGALVVNIGDKLRRISNGRYNANLHRVINKSSRERYSIAFFVDGNLDFLLDPIVLDGEDAKYEQGLTIHEHMMRRFRETYQKSYGDRTEAPKVAA